MQHIEGWYLPDDDNYFGPYLKENGSFQSDRLVHAFSYVDNWSLAIDGGAHIGLWSVLMSKHFKAVEAFEPVLDTYQCLVKNVVEGGHASVISWHHLALGNKEGYVNIGWDEKYRQMGNTGSKFVIPSAQNENSVRMVTIDGFNFSNLGFLKLDVEGAEYLALKGAELTIKKFKPVIYIECKKGYSQRFGYADNSALNFLQGIGYKIAERIKSDYILKF